MSRQALIAILVAAVVAWLGFALQHEAAVQTSSANMAAPQGTAPVEVVAALGRLEPEGEVTRVSAGGQNSRILRLLVREGTRVKGGDVIAVLDGVERLTAAVEQARRGVDVACAHREQVKAGAKPGDIAAQMATIARLEAELGHATTECARFDALFREGAVSASLLDSKRLLVDSLSEQLHQASAALDSLREVRVTDVRRAEAEVASAIAAVRKANADLQLAFVKAPRHGQILKVYAKPGETIGQDGIVDLGDTIHMCAVAEVYETDISRVHLGQTATIFSESLSTRLTGTVERIGLRIGRKALLDADPAADVDARVVEVRIRLSEKESRKVCGLTNMRVKVAILVPSTGAGPA